MLLDRRPEIGLEICDNNMDCPVVPCPALVLALLRAQEINRTGLSNA